MKKKHIYIDSKIHFGQPCISRSRIPVHCILELVQAGIPFAKIVDKYYPDITIDDIKSCVEYAANIIKAEEVHIGES
jgi:uncharacterized protein (DUF433 family)